MKFETDFDALCRDLSALTEGVPYVIANLANTAALLWERMEGLNWAGFYILTDGALVLGPFQGKTACIRITWGGVSAARRRSRGEPNWWKTSMISQGISPATVLPIPKSWCRCIRTVHSGECWIWTALILDGLPRRIGRGWRKRPKEYRLFYKIASTY